ncbi:carboxypeptidase s [Phaffia rhodozyma]|uniref:Carboxypeptidase s n=1 Tax=Phaffia rhodozyma TaxID=264483 RepID=A0A0F7SHB6_PHARH|nr:carboxypeptidase s [Phaffia rhodozyma]
MSSSSDTGSNNIWSNFFSEPFSDRVLSLLPGKSHKDIRARRQRGVRSDNIPETNVGPGEEQPLLSDFHQLGGGVSYGTSGENDEAPVNLVRVPKKVVSVINVEPKVWFANERTWLAYLSISILLGTLAGTLLAATNHGMNAHRAHITKIFAGVYAVIALVVLLYGYAIFQKRVTLIKKRSGKHFDEVVFPLLISIAIFIAILANFIIRVQEFESNPKKRFRLSTATDSHSYIDEPSTSTTNLNARYDRLSREVGVKKSGKRFKHKREVDRKLSRVNEQKLVPDIDSSEEKLPGLLVDTPFRSLATPTWFKPSPISGSGVSSDGYPVSTPLTSPHSIIPFSEPHLAEPFSSVARNNLPPPLRLSTSPHQDLQLSYLRKFSHSSHDPNASSDLSWSNWTSSPLTAERYLTDHARSDPSVFDEDLFLQPGGGQDIYQQSPIETELDGNAQDRLAPWQSQMNNDILFYQKQDRYFPCTPYSTSENIPFSKPHNMADHHWISTGSPLLHRSILPTVYQPIINSPLAHHQQVLSRNRLAEDFIEVTSPFEPTVSTELDTAESFIGGLDIVLTGTHSTSTALELRRSSARHISRKASPSVSELGPDSHANLFLNRHILPGEPTLNPFYDDTSTDFESAHSGLANLSRHHSNPADRWSEYKSLKCPVQVKTILPAKTLVLPSGYRAQSAKRLSDAVKQATISYDDNGLPTEDKRWLPFFGFQTWLQDTFPAVFEHPAVTYEAVNTLGILTTVKGSDPSLKPLLLLSHYDVTPAPLETYGRWTHAPFSGFIDDEYVWGRGASDDKTLLIGQYEALSLLLSDPDWVPRRTVILSHGFDEEEVFQRQGAGELAKFLENRYGKDSMLLVIDEGNSFADAWGDEFAVPASSEKGYLDVKFTVGTTGGHSSIPPSHSGIGIMADIIHALEDNPYSPSFGPDDPTLAFLTCAAEFAPKFPRKWSKLIKDGSRKSLTHLANEFGKTSPFNHALVTTTQAIDVIHGGSKVNSLPEEVTLLMNHRVSFDSNLTSVQKSIASLIKPIASHYGLAFSAFAEDITKSIGSDVQSVLGSKYIKVETLGVPLEPAPRSVVDGEVWGLLAGSIKAAFPKKDGGERIVSPSTMTGNTDTKVYHSLSNAIYRFKGDGPGGGNAHTVDEKAPIEGHLGIIRWIHTIIQNADAYNGPQ